MIFGDMRIDNIDKIKEQLGDTKVLVAVENELNAEELKEILRNNKLEKVLIFTGTKNSYRAFIYFLLFDEYKIYTKEELMINNDIDIEALNTAFSREVDFVELKQCFKKKAELFTAKGKGILMEVFDDIIFIEDMFMVYEKFDRILREFEYSEEQYKQIIDNLKRKFEYSIDEEEQYKQIIDNLKRKFEYSEEQYKQIIDNLKRKVDEYELNLSIGTISDYVTINTTLVKTKIPIIIYFKEFSYVRFINSFVINFINYLKALGVKNLKLIIFDNSPLVFNIYMPIQVVDNKKIKSDLGRILDLDKLVINEVSTIGLEEIIKNDDRVSILIVYDRLRKSKDLITGNNVFKFLVLGTKQEYRYVQKENLLDKVLIVFGNSYWDNNVIVIPEIPSYNEKSASAKVAEYNKVLKYGDKDLFKYLIDSLGIIGLMQHK